MAEASVVRLEPERTSLRVQLRRTFHRARARIFPRRWVIPWEMRDHGRYYRQAIAEARATSASRNDIQMLEAEATHFYGELEEELEMLESSRLLTQADKLMLPTPEFLSKDDDPHWRQGTTFKPTWYLRREAMQTLRAQILAARKARREPVGDWVKIIGAAVGGVGGGIVVLEKVVGLLHR